MCLTPIMSSTAKCSTVWGWGAGWEASTTKRAPSTTAAPDTIVATKTSCPGTSRSDILLMSLGSAPLGHFPFCKIPSL